ncbi:FCS-Like Zinc finger 18 [Linum grandiflorum]
MSLKMMNINPLQNLAAAAYTLKAGVGLQTLLMVDTSASVVFNYLPIHSYSAKIHVGFVVAESFTTIATPLSRLVKKYCNLCSSELSPDKDVYMYRGDQGFCSIKCRDTQIQKDELENDHQYYSSSSNSSCCYCNTDHHRRNKKSPVLFEIATSSKNSSSTDEHTGSHVARCRRGCRHFLDKESNPARKQYYNIPRYQNLLYHKHQR